ncbi:hypothetical protein CNECB9_1560016 [Cupriavidus necator]|uniref:Uncharacterized protein n=1 Tax=Cupriavidus necator TaxID=106590 RepID=A0A1K0IA07_CUPNE|nr:hypothetical protein CNECB9_1560016 [Cupriavidus necator]
MSAEPPPIYAIGDFDCYRCSRPRLYVVSEYPYDRLKFDCAVNQYTPFVGSCPSFSREPGVD